MNEELIPVALDKDLVRKLLDGLYNGAKGKALKVVISTDNNFHINSKGLHIIMENDATGKAVVGIEVFHDRFQASVTADQLKEMNLDTHANQVLNELRDRYSPYFHSLADNIVLFSRAYGNPPGN